MLRSETKLMLFWHATVWIRILRNEIVVCESVHKNASLVMLFSDVFIYQYYYS